MYLRAENEDEAARGRQECLAADVARLEGKVDDPRSALDLANILGWEGHYGRTVEIVGPFMDGPFGFEARQCIADTHFRHDQYDRARDQNLINLAAAQEAGDEYWTARAKDSLAWVLVEVGTYYSGEFLEAAELFNETQVVYRNLRRKLPEAMGLQGLSRAAAGAGDYDRAIEFASQSLEMLEAIGAGKYVQVPLHTLATVYRDQGSFHTAQEYFERALVAADRSQHSCVQAAVALDYGRTLWSMGCAKEAKEILVSALPIIHEFGFPSAGYGIYELLATVAAGERDFQRAYESHKKSHEYGCRLGVLVPRLQNQHAVLRRYVESAAAYESELRYLSAGVEASQNAILVLATDSPVNWERGFRVKFLNGAAAQLLDSTPERLIHLPLKDVWKTPGVEKLIEKSITVYETSEPVTLDPIQLDLPAAHGRWHWVQITKNLKGVAWSIADVTEREHQRARLTEANERLVALDREKTDMLQMAAHDLRSPISNIYSLCDFITPSDPDNPEYLRLIQTSAKSLLALINNLLDVNRIERGEIAMHMDDLEVNLALTEVIREFAAISREKRILIRHETALTEAIAFADWTSLRQVLENLISNALKFSSLGLTIEIRATKVEDRIRIEVEDHGPGLSAEDKSMLFRKFARLTPQPTGGETSTGLGLSIVKRLTEAMGGEAGCDSTVGVGSTFWVELRTPSHDPTVS